MQTISDLSSNFDKNLENSEIDSKLSADLDLRLTMNPSAKKSELRTDENEDYEEEREDGEEDEEFSFAINGGNSSPISADVAFEDGQIRPIYPLFNRDLLLGHEDFDFSETRLPVRPPVEKVFIETPPSPSRNTDGLAAGPYCTWSKNPELSKKSNSTGFSKLWRFKEYMRRSNSAGRDAYVFFNPAETKTDVKVAERKSVGDGSSEKKTAGDSKDSVAGEKKKGKRVQKTVSPHEVYLRNKKDEEKRRSYLPYRPELVGFFTNVNGGGLSKNVHPY